ncbi:MAG: hypothetical protein IJP90_15035 [Treponema sp.]|nr:hypothetical protein [Treponema sp.]
MKKIIAIVFAFVFAMGAWSATQERPYYVLVGGALSTPVQTEKTKYNGDEISTSMTAIGFDFLFGSLPKEGNWGFISNFSFAFPQSITAKYKGEDYDVSKSDFKKLFLYDFTIAPEYFFLKKENGFIGIGPAFNLSMFAWDLEYVNGMNYSFGLGAILFGALKFAGPMYLFANVSGIYNFYTIGSVRTAYDTYSTSGALTNFALLPAFGICLSL